MREDRGERTDAIVLLVILGAGASYDCTPILRRILETRDPEERPPLGHELFAPRRKFLEAIRSFSPLNEIVPYLTNLPADGSIEAILQRMQNEADKYKRRHSQLAALRWYLHFIFYGSINPGWLSSISGISNYSTLLDQIDQLRPQNESVLFVTFNYDKLFESALEGRGLVLKDFPDYIAHRRFKLIKLHGSSDWARAVETPVPGLAEMNAWQAARWLIDNASQLKVSSRYSVITEYPIGRALDVPLYPAIAIPLETKLDFECPADHVSHLEKSIPKVSRILSVGWRAGDLPLLQMLAKALPKNVEVMVVATSTNGCDSVVSRMRTAGIQAKYESAPFGFTGFVVERHGVGFLSS
jgi:hypothetical protein